MPTCTPAEPAALRAALRARRVQLWDEEMLELQNPAEFPLNTKVSVGG